MKSVRTLGVTTLLLAAVACATGVWWFGLVDRRAEVIEERGDIEVASADVRAADLVVSRAIVLSLDDDAAGSFDGMSVDEARSVAADAVVSLAASESTSGEVHAALDRFRSTALAITEELAAGDPEEARLRYSTELAPARDAFEGVVERAVARSDLDLTGLASGVAWVSAVATIAAGASVVGVIALAVAVARMRRWTSREPATLRPLPAATTRRPERESHVVIQLPTGPNTLTPRRRYPRVEDLGWLIGDAMRPYRARGWEASLRCPVIGADCDPADVREILNSLFDRADSADADRIGIIVRPTASRVQVVVADDGESIFGPDSYLSASEPVRLRSSIRTRTEADTAELTWSRFEHLNVAVLDLPRLGIVVPIGADA